MFLIKDVYTTSTKCNRTPLALDYEWTFENVNIFILTDVDDINPFDIFGYCYFFSIVLEDCFDVHDITFSFVGVGWLVLLFLFYTLDKFG